MSIVGTRPPLISETNLYEPRHKVIEELAVTPYKFKMVNGILGAEAKLIF